MIVTDAYQGDTKSRSFFILSVSVTLWFKKECRKGQVTTSSFSSSDSELVHPEFPAGLAEEAKDQVVGAHDLK